MKDADSKSKSFDLNEFIETLNTLDPQSMGSWPVAVKVFISMLAFLGILLLGYVFVLSGAKADLATGKQEQETLLAEYEQKIFKAKNLEIYKKQLQDMEDSFGALLRQLPQDTEIPGLLDDVTQTGISSGVEFDSIDLGAESKKEFYIEQPINIKAQGDYHAFGAFMSEVAALPRIVTLHDFSIQPVARNKDAAAISPVLSLTIQAKTYRYADTGAEGGVK